MTEPTIKEKMEKLLTDEIFNPEPCDIRLFATNVARLICEEMTKENLDIGWLNLKQAKVGKEFEKGYINRIEETKQKAQEIFKVLESILQST